MLSLKRLAVFMLAYVLLLLWARLRPEAARQVWRLKWVLAGLFLLDWLLVGLDLAAIVTLRLILLAGAFALFFTTTTPRELQSALEWLHVPYRYAFSVSLAFQSIGLLEDEWHTIREAQRSRGAWSPIAGWRFIRHKVGDLVSLTVPAVVLTAKRAWAMTEAAYARGFESPHRRPCYRLTMRGLDWTLLASALAASAALVLWR
jgi:energy-coupling factor transport system permease protein